MSVTPRYFIVMRLSPDDPIEVTFLSPTDHGLPGRIGLMEVPRDLEADLDRLRNHYRADVIVSLLESGDFEFLGITDLAERAAERGIESLRFPIPDLGVPPQAAMAAFLDLVESLLASARAGKTVVIHCYAGRGRSGMVAACCFVFLGHTPEAAIGCVREVRPGAIETRAQERWIEAVAKALLDRARPSIR